MNWRGLTVACALASSPGCSATSASTSAPPPAATTAAPVASTPASAVVPVASTTAPTLTPEQELARAVEAARRCDAPAAEITNAPPEDGVVFNNAQTDPDAGYIDRLAAIVGTIRGTAAYRCCFDAWQTQHPEEELKVMMQITLDPKGGVKETGVDAKRTNADDAVLIGCLGAVARGSEFPPSPTGKDTQVDYPFVVAARDTSP